MPIRQLVESYQPQGYSDEVKKNCLTLYLNGIGFRGIERATGVCNNTVINWVKQFASTLPNPPEPKRTPAVAQLDELQTFIQRKNKIWIWTAVDQAVSRILAWVIGERSS
jgi:insertion element IS1 protein InsB